MRDTQFISYKFPFCLICSKFYYCCVHFLIHQNPGRKQINRLYIFFLTYHICIHHWEYRLYVPKPCCLHCGLLTLAWTAITVHSLCTIHPTPTLDIHVPIESREVISENIWIKSKYWLKTLDFFPFKVTTICYLRTKGFSWVLDTSAYCSIRPQHIV